MTRHKFKLDFWTVVTISISLLFALFLIYPLISLFMSSFRDPATGVFTFNNFIKFVTKKYYYQGLLNSFKVTICVTILAVLLGAPMAYIMNGFRIKGKRLVEILIVAYVIRRLPYTLRSSAAILYQISPSMEEASISLGYSPVRTFFKVTAIMILPGVLSGAILSWITVINELSASVILYTGGTRAMSVAIYSEVIRASYGTAAALSTILTVTTVISLLIFYRFSGSREVSV